MKKHKWAVIILLVLLLLSIPRIRSFASENNQIDWIPDPSVIDESRLKQKPGMLYFYSEPTSPVEPVGETGLWDPSKLKLGLPEETLNHLDIVALSRNFSCFRINLKRLPQVFDDFKVWIYPTLIFTDPWLNEVHRASGVVSVETIIRLMEVFPLDYTDAARWNGVLKEDDKNFEALEGMAAFYLELGSWYRSNLFYERALKTKEARSSEETLESIMLLIGLNELRLKDYSDAQETFEDCLGTVADGRQSDRVLLGLIIAQLGQDKIGGAERSLKKLRAQYPDSPAVQQAERYIQSVKDSKR